MDGPFGGQLKKPSSLASVYLQGKLYKIINKGLYIELMEIFPLPVLISAGYL